MVKLEELDVLIETLAETERFTRRLKQLIKEVKSKDVKNNSRSNVKRSAIDLKLQLSKVTRSTGIDGTYYYE